MSRKHAASIKTLYTSIDQLQADLDEGRTPYQAFLDGKAVAVESSGEEVNPAARHLGGFASGG